jgi:hypothetical protein
MEPALKISMLIDENARDVLHNVGVKGRPRTLRSFAVGPVTPFRT